MYPYWEGENWAGFGCIRVRKYETGPDFARTRVGAQKHTPRNVLRQRLAPKTGRGFHVPLIGDNEIGWVFGGYVFRKA